MLSGMPYAGLKKFWQLISQSRLEPEIENLHIFPDLPRGIPLVPRLLYFRARIASERPGEITMRPTFRKLEVKDISSLEQLVAENVEGIEPGLKIVDTRLLLGQAAIDLVGVDTRNSLVLIALDF